MRKRALTLILLATLSTGAYAKDTKAAPPDPTQDALMMGAGFLTHHPDMKYRLLGMDAVKKGRYEDALFRSLITADAFPALREAIDAGAFLDESDPFAFGLARSLDGVAAYVERAAAGHREPRPEWEGLDDAEIADDKRYRDAQKAVRDAEKTLRDARKIQRQVARDARERRARARGDR